MGLLGTKEHAANAGIVSMVEGGVLLGAHAVPLRAIQRAEEAADHGMEVLKVFHGESVQETVHGFSPARIKKKKW